MKKVKKYRNSIIIASLLFSMFIFDIQRENKVKQHTDERNSK